MSAIPSDGNFREDRPVPRGEAVHFAEHVVDLGVPEPAIIVEPQAAKTGQNIDFSRTALTEASPPLYR